MGIRSRSARGVGRTSTAFSRPAPFHAVAALDQHPPQHTLPGGRRQEVREQPQRRPVVAQSNPRLVALLETYLDRLLSSMLRAMFGEGTVPPEIKSQLTDLTIASCVTDWIPPGVPKTGIVFAGYGANDVRPMFLEL